MSIFEKVNAGVATNGEDDFAIEAPLEVLIVTTKSL